MKVSEDEWTQIQGKRVRGSVLGTRMESIGPEAVVGKPRAKRTPSHSNMRRSTDAIPVGTMPVIGIAGLAPAPSPNKPPYKSKLELAWAMRLEVMKRQGEIDGWVYEPFTFRLAEGKRYRVDFISWKWVESIQVDGSSVGYYVTTCYECKGWHKNYRDSLTHLKWAAQRFPFFQWKKVVRNGKSGFEVYDVVV